MDLWIANLADGSTKEEEWLPGYISPWQRLIEYCKKQNTYIRALRLHMGEKVVQCPDNARGYWQAHAMPSVQGVVCDEELHKWRGIGWVNDDDAVQIIWGARDPKTHQTVFWADQRPSGNQAQIIWGPRMVFVPLEDRGETPRGTAPVRGIKKYSDRIVEDAGGLRELYVPAHHNH